jgi:hypothetical protein
VAGDVMTPARYSFLGFPVSEPEAEKLADKLVLRDERDGRLVVRMRTQEFVGVPRRRRWAA